MGGRITDILDVVGRAKKPRRVNRAHTREEKRVTDGVYVITDDCGATKVGVAVDVNVRLGTLQNGNPRPLRVAFYQKVSNPYAIERCVHSVLTKVRAVGEWFWTDSETAVAAVQHVIVDDIIDRAPIDPLEGPATLTGDALADMTVADAEDAGEREGYRLGQELMRERLMADLKAANAPARYLMAIAELEILPLPAKESV